MARVSVQHKEQYRVITAAGEMQAVISGKLGYAAADAPDYPAVGDWVLVDRLDDSHGNAIIRQILPRRTVFRRKAAGMSVHGQIIAANIDQLFICMALDQDFSLRRLERYLTIAWDSGAIPVVVLTKSDLCDDLDARLAETRAIALGVDILPPDFAALAKSCHVQHQSVSSREQLREALIRLADTRQPVLLELDAAAFLSA